MIRNKAEETRNRILARAAEATPEDHLLVDRLIKQALTGDFQSETTEISAAAAGILFIQHNSHNRDWSYLWSEEIERRINVEEWKQNNATIGFYKTGKLADGQNRLGGAALSGKSVKVAIVYGIEEDAASTIDDIRRRAGSDSSRLVGIQDAKRKEQVVKMHAAYLTKSGVETAKLHSNTEVDHAIRENDGTLSLALELGSKSCDNISSPVLKETQAQAVAYLLVKGGWDKHTVTEKLHLFQTGVSNEGENSPFFVAAKLVEASRNSTAKRDKMTTTKELGLVILAMQESEKGTKAVGRQRFRDAVKKNMPSPEYPSKDGEQEQAA